MTLALRPGADLDESKLSEEFQLSRTPLREVLRQLAGEGYVDLRENRGARVSEMSHMTLRDFFLAAPMIYGAVLQLAAKNATEMQIAALKAAQEDFKAALRTGSGADRAMANNRFHEITGEMADNIYLLPSFQRLLIDHARIGMTFYRPQDRQMAENLGPRPAPSTTPSSLPSKRETRRRRRSWPLTIGTCRATRSSCSSCPPGLTCRWDRQWRAKPLHEDDDDSQCFVLKGSTRPL